MTTKVLQGIATTCLIMQLNFHILVYNGVGHSQALGELIIQTYSSFCGLTAQFQQFHHNFKYYLNAYYVMQLAVIFY